MTSPGASKQQEPPRAGLTTVGLVNLNAAWFGLGYLWNGLHTILLPVMLVGLVPASLKNTYLGGLTFTGLLLAMVAQPIAGTLSDRSGWLGRYGKRRPWMVLGAFLDVLFLAGLALVGNLWLVVLGYVGLQLASSVVEASLQGLLPDLVPSAQRGRASGYKNAAQIAGFVAGVGLGGLLAGKGHLDWALAVTAVTVLVTVLWTVFGVREAPVTRMRRRALGLAEALRELFVRSFQFDQQAVPGYARLLAGRALLLGGFFALQGFAQYYVADVLVVPDPPGTTALLMAVMGVAVFLLAVPTGALADRVGRKPLNLAAGVLGALATLALILVTNTSQLIIVGGLVGASVGIFLSVNWAWAADLVPADQAGRYLGLSNLATAGASAFSRLLAGPIVDTGNAFHLGLGYNVLFLVLAAGMAVGTFLLAAVPETGAQPGEAVVDPVSVDVER